MIIQYIKKLFFHFLFVCIQTTTLLEAMELLADAVQWLQFLTCTALPLNQVRCPPVTGTTHLTTTTTSNTTIICMAFQWVEEPNRATPSTARCAGHKLRNFNSQKTTSGTAPWQLLISRCLPWLPCRPSTTTAPISSTINWAIITINLKLVHQCAATLLGGISWVSPVVITLYPVPRCPSNSGATWFSLFLRYSCIALVNTISNFTWDSFSLIWSTQLLIE